ncbi:MAG: DUF202 domain-containing protein [Corynebacterium sp.]|nr:DUF202 domain-containing protein [Corynebacterium sp.]
MTAGKAPGHGQLPERTTLSWNRTILALVIVAVTQLKLGEHSFAIAPWMLIAILPVGVTAVRRYVRQLQGISTEYDQPEIILILFTGLSVSVLSAVMIYHQWVN